MSTNPDRPPQPARPAVVAVLVLLAVVLCAGLLALGIWQVQRLQWKLALIDRIEQRVSAAPAPAPGPSEWSGISREASEYKRVQVSGRFDHSKQTLVRASTELGRGFWVITPLQTPAGFWVLVNRGFVPSANSLQSAEPSSADLPVITGLLRLSEPAGSLLQGNDAAAGRWYSRDVSAIAASVKLAATPVPPGVAPVAPYFIDAAASAPAAWPRGGLTVLQFNNHHIVYAITWFVLAAMTAGAATYLVRSERRLRAQALDKPAVTHA